MQQTLTDSRPPSSAVSRPVDATLSEIITLHGEILTAARKTLSKAIRIGELLACQKKKLTHGRWLDFVLSELPFSERTAQNYMRVFARRARLKSANVADLGKAYRLLADAFEAKPTAPRAGATSLEATRRSVLKATDRETATSRRTVA